MSWRISIGKTNKPAAVGDGDCGGAFSNFEPDMADESHGFVTSKGEFVNVSASIGNSVFESQNDEKWVVEVR